MSNAAQQHNCNQRTKYFSLVNIGNINTRYEPVSPYPAHTKEQLDMRRKAVILQYPSNSTSRTKYQSWVYLVKYGSARSRHICPDYATVNVPTSSSDVPGPVVYLHNDLSVPLYMYKNVQNYQNALQYVAYTDTVQPLWNAIPIPDAILEDNVSSNLANLVLLSPDEPTYYYNIQTPIALSINGIKETLPITDVSGSVSYININVSEILFHVYYSDQLISTRKIPTTEFSNMTVSVDKTTGHFTASKYIGELVVKNIKLTTLFQYIYTFKVDAKLVYTEYNSNGIILSEKTSNVNNITAKMIGNLLDISDHYYFEAFNCSVINPPNYKYISQFTLTGHNNN